MKEFYTDDYVRLTHESLKNQLRHAVENYGAWKGAQVFVTSLELGRQTGKTKAAVQLSNELGGMVIYVGHNTEAGLYFKRLGGKTEFVVSKRTVGNYFRGRRIEGNQVTLIFDECDLRTSEMFEIAQNVAYSFGRAGWGNYIHVIRLGM